YPPASAASCGWCGRQLFAKCSSSSWWCADSGDCSRCNRSAARAKCNSSATAKKHLRCRSSIAHDVLADEATDALPATLTAANTSATDSTTSKVTKPRFCPAMKGPILAPTNKTKPL